MSPTPAVEFRQVCKRFGSVQANADVNLRIAKGSIHGLVGENGAGKSTLMSILYGYYRADSGSILLDGQAQQIRSSQDAIRLGIGMVHQHFMLVDQLSVLDNVMLGAAGGFRLAPQRVQVAARLRELAALYQLEVDPDALIQDLSVGAQQRVEILKQIYLAAHILILDEPTAVLTPQETHSLFTVLRRFQAQGKTIILISHKLQEILAITDQVSVLRGGRVVAEMATADTNAEALATLMVGRPVQQHLPRAAWNPGQVMLQVSGLHLHNAAHRALLKDVQFQVRAGEIVAIAGVSGNGQSELLEVLSGMRLPDQGSLQMAGQELPYRQRRDADGLPAHYRRLGIAHVPEDRLQHGVIKDFSVLLNAMLGYQEKAEKVFGLLDFKAIAQRCARLLTLFAVRPADPALRLGLLSGGNQQKVVLAREMDAQPKLLLVGQPTRGVDIGTIESIHTQLLTLRDAGVAILLVSAELEEVRSLADRILVMADGRITGELAAADFDATRIGLLMAGARS